MALIINARGQSSLVNIERDTLEDLRDLCGQGSRFKCHHVWSRGNSKISMYGCTKGKKENKFEFPPPVESVLFFDKCLLVNRESGVVAPLTEAQWRATYETLFGGFEDLEEESDSSCESTGLQVTKHGYVKDGFVVSDDEF